MEICRSILIRDIADRKQVILIQNAFLTIEKYIMNRHRVGSRYVLVAPTTQEEIVDSLKYMLSLKEEGLNLFFTDIDKINEMMLKVDNLSIFCNF